MLHIDLFFVPLGVLDVNSRVYEIYLILLLYKVILHQRHHASRFKTYKKRYITLVRNKKREHYARVLFIHIN